MLIGLVVISNKAKNMDSIEIRASRPNLGATQGHYFQGIDYADALKKAQAKFPNEPLNVRTFKTLLNGKWLHTSDKDKLVQPLSS